MTPQSILSAVSEASGVPEKILTGQRRLQSVAIPRHAAVFLLKTMLNLSNREISGIMNRTHSAIIRSFSIASSDPLIIEVVKKAMALLPAPDENWSRDIGIAGYSHGTQANYFVKGSQ